MLRCESCHRSHFPSSSLRSGADGSAASSGSGKRQGWSYKERKRKSTCSCTAWVMKQRTFCSLSLLRRNRRSCTTLSVKAQFDVHFIPRRNVIFERARFNSRKQEQGEPVDVFITALYTLSERCNYGSLREEMIRDSIVVGIRNAQLSRRSCNLTRNSP